MEHWFALKVPDQTVVTLAPSEHIAFKWLPHEEAAKKCFSPSNEEAIRKLFSEYETQFICPLGIR